ncbi:hemicentin-1-like [Branchiostoma floridae]|uniref:Hemicentin-1-like n=1 Tax=Branchiostoma floridae TaxID=7739 RepID=A0A9J7LQ03_BRAFL|nr:hemicentin-1-like [Branchiostoma floridae]
MATDGSDPEKLYSALGVPPTATHDEIVAAYTTELLLYEEACKLSRTDNVFKKAHVKHKEVRKAFTVLSDASRRQQYNDSHTIPGAPRFSKKSLKQPRNYCIQHNAQRMTLAQSDIGLTLPEQVNTVLGDPVTLAASYSTNRQVELLSWYKIDSNDPSKRVLVLSYSPMRGLRTYHNFVERVELAGPASLKILQTRAEDEGKYVLSLLVEEVGSVDGFVTLHILVPPVVEVGPSNPYVIGLGKAALLTCTVMNAKPNISSLHWKKDGTIVDSNLMNTKFSGGTMASPSLMIRHVTRTDAGLYTCVADHVVKQERSSLRLSVLCKSHF